jgi:hypothetical protein
MLLRPERPFHNIHGSLGEEPNASDVISGSFGVIREIAVPSAAAR